VIFHHRKLPNSSVFTRWTEHCTFHPPIPKAKPCSTCSAHNSHCDEGEPTASPDFQWEDKFHGYTEPFWDNDVDSILHHQYFMLNEQYIDRDHTLSFTVPIYEYRHL
jgi:hypothetical protein